MANKSQITNFVHSAVSLYLAGGMDNEGYEFNQNKDMTFAYTKYDFSHRTERINNQEFIVTADNQEFVVSIRKKRGAS